MGEKMQVTETTADGLYREFQITIPASELDEKLNVRLESIKDRVNLKGFRPGKVPVDHLRKAYGKQVMGEIIEETLTESSQKALEERSIRAAMQPTIDLTSNADEVLDGGKDLEFKVGVELMPEIEIMDLKAVKIERPVAKAGDTEVEEQLTALASSQRSFEPKGDDAAAELDDQTTIDFAGSIDGIAFDGGRGEDMPLVLGSGQFIPGFEEQLIGKKAGDACEVKVTFPEEYQVPDLAGKEAVFDVTVKAVGQPAPVTIDDDFAKRLGVESLEALKKAIRARLEHDFNGLARGHAKRRLLDALDGGHKFELPQRMVDTEFQAIWQQVLQDLEQRGKKIEDEADSEDAMREEYRGIAERRVRLGLVLAEIGQQNSIDVTQEEMGRALNEVARQYPGQEREIYEYYQQNVGAMAQLRAPVFEDKVVDFVLELADVTDKDVSKVELMRDPGEDDA